MRWHDSDRIEDGNLRHPAHSQVWKAFDNWFKLFASDSRSIRLGFASDRFNPFCRMSTTYSTWPILLIPYNLPPWSCMKQHSLIGPRNDIDIYLQPLIHELKQLWNCIDVYDAFAF